MAKPYTQELFASLDEVAAELLGLISSFNEEEMNTVPFKNSWTAAQVTEHIIRSNRSIVQSINVAGQAIARDPGERIPELRETFLDFSTKLKSPGFILPTHDVYIKDTLIADLERSIERLRDAREKFDLSEALTNPAFGEITKFEILHFTVYHTQRHIQQLRKIFSIVAKEKNRNVQTTQINAYLNFDGNCREAMNFYKDCLGGSLVLQTVEGTPMEAQCPSAMKNMILHSTLAKNGLMLMGSDMTGPEGFTKGTNISLSLNCSSKEEINTFFTNLSAGGKIIDPLKEQFWGATFGALTDKFGIRWMLNYNNGQSK